MLGTATKRKNLPKDGPKLKVQLFGKLQTQDTQKVQSEDESDTQSEILCPNLVNETQEVPPVLHFYSDLHTVPDTLNSTMSSLLKGKCIQAVSVKCEVTICRNRVSPK